jgi:hypothetical protein
MKESTKAMKLVEQMLKEDFKYMYKQKKIDINTWHLTFIMDSKTHNLQMSFNFREQWIDILCFISPTILVPSSNENYWEALRTVNYINWNIKSWGRYYIDSFGDLAYSLRISHSVLENVTYECIKEIECAIDYYADLFIPLLNVCQGKTSFENTKLSIDDMWGTVSGQ